MCRASFHVLLSFCCQTAFCDSSIEPGALENTDAPGGTRTPALRMINSGCPDGHCRTFWCVLVAAPAGADAGGDSQSSELGSATGQRKRTGNFKSEKSGTRPILPWSHPGANS